MTSLVQTTLAASDGSSGPPLALLPQTKMMPRRGDMLAELTADRSEFTDPNISEQDNINHLMTDLVSKIGLRLESQRTPVEILVIDHAEKPDEN